MASQHPGAIPEKLAEQGIRFVRVLWCDNANVIRAKAIHVDALSRQGRHGVGLSAAQQAVPVMFDAPVPGGGLGPVGEVWLVPDWSTLRLLPYAPGHARVMGMMFQQGNPWPWGPRQFLRRMVQAAAVMGITVQAAFESEFYLLKATGQSVGYEAKMSAPKAPKAPKAEAPEPGASKSEAPNPGISGLNTIGLMPADQTLFSATAAMDQHYGVINDIADALGAQQIKVEQYYPESGPGQQEISIHYGPALQAADQHIMFRETVRAVAHRHGLVASFLPKIFDHRAGSGCHLHLSLWQGDRNIMGDDQGGLSAQASAFVAGILRHLPALMAVTTPIPNSYRRIRPQCWSGAFRAWGYDNREAAVRVPSHPGSPSPTQIELKTVDNAANPYLALGCVIAAGLDGLSNNLRLDNPVQVDPGLLSAAERNAQGITPLPTSLADAIAHLKQNTVLIRALGKPLAQTFLAVRQAEWEAMHELPIEEEVKLLLERY